jgi:predicted O-methyltransferase YrrM
MMKNFKFTHDWFSENINNSMKMLELIFKGKINNILEIGSHEGRSATWMLEKLCDLEGSTFTSIDPYLESDITCDVKSDTQQIFHDNISICDNYSKFDQFVNYSAVILPQLIEKGKQYNIIYVDGSHTYVDVMNDLIQCDKLLKPLGVMIIDDVGTNLNGYIDLKRAFTQFMQDHPNYRVILNDYQRTIIKWS